MRFRHTLSVVVLGLLHASPAAGQQPPATPVSGATIRGVVVDSLADAPLAEAVVQLVATGARAPSVRTTATDSLGRFAFPEVAEGQYLLGFLHPVLDSLGLEPIYRAVSVAGGREIRADLAVPAPARLVAALCGAPARAGAGVAREAIAALCARRAAVLDTLRVFAPSRSSLTRSGFEERRLSFGTGRFLTADDIRKLRLWNTSEVFKYIPGLIGTRSSMSMRSAFGGECRPAIVLNGHILRDLDTYDLDALVSPREIAGVEVYLESQVPPQFQVALGGCGSIVLWTK